MLREESMAVLEGNGLIHMLGRITLEDFRQAVSEMWSKVFENIRRI